VVSDGVSGCGGGGLVVAGDAWMRGWVMVRLGREVGGWVWSPGEVRVGLLWEEVCCVEGIFLG
jgi:hypothetical protein